MRVPRRSRRARRSGPPRDGGGHLGGGGSWRGGGSGRGGGGGNAAGEDGFRLRHLLAALGLALSPFFVLAVLSDYVSPGSSQPDVVQASITNDLGMPVWMSVCQDSACQRLDPGGWEVAAGASFQQPVAPEQRQIFLVRGLIGGTRPGTMIITGEKRCVSLATGSVVAARYALSALTPC
jgi:hypothetical protein